MSEPTFTAGDLAAYLKAPGDDPLIPRALRAAETMIDHHLRDAIRKPPQEIRDLAIQEVAADLYNRRFTRNGIANFDGPDFQPLRVARDPLKAAADILRPYMHLGIA